LKAPSPIVLLVLLVPALLACSAGGAPTAGDRQDFLAAEAALARGDLGGLDRIATTLKGYPLYPYLLYERLSADLGKADPDAIEGFLSEHADTPLAGRLRRAWLGRLAEAGRWKEYLHFYTPDDSILRRCQYLHALLSEGRRDEVFEQMESLWLRGRSLPGACDPLLDAWKEAGFLTSDLVWRRIALAMTTGEVRLVRYLGRSLPADERIWLDRWIDVRRDPRQLLDADAFVEASPYRPRILADGIARLAPKVPSAAADLWDRLSARIDFPEEQAQQVDTAVGFALAASGDPKGLSYLSRVPVRLDNLALQERRLRAALGLGHWDRVADWIAAMPAGPRKSEQWLYWQARAEEALGNAGVAEDLFETAAAERSLWGFLAAERTGRPYKLGNTPVPANPQRLSRIGQSATTARIRELEVLGREGDLAREWQWLIHDMDSVDLMAAAVFARQRGWPKRAILTLAKSGYWDDLALRFPLLYGEIVRDQSLDTGLDESWIYAVLRQESIFDPGASSVTGAMGLMQLMPDTAREVARTLGLQHLRRNQIRDPRLNITLGSAYLAGMRRRFDGNPVLATAAYNAGPANVDRWLPEHSIEADLWIATIPWHETRVYVRRVLAYRLIYDYRLGKRIEPLHQSMRQIGRTDGKGPGTEYSGNENPGGEHPGASS
jgi:soluble lytic murein transglycosylase